MSPFISEAFFTGLKESIKIASVGAVFFSILREKNGIGKYFIIGLLGSFLVIPIAFSIFPEIGIKDLIVRLTGYAFFIFFLLSILYLYHSTGTEIFFGWHPPTPSKKLLGAITLCLSIFYFSPDVVGSGFYLRELSIMKSNPKGVYLSCSVGFILPLLVFILPPLRGFLIKNLSRYFDIPQFFLFLSIIKLIGGGVRGYVEFSLIPLVQAGLMKFIHDFVHQTFVFLMVPDHPMLQLTVWNFIGILFGSNIAMGLALILLLVPIIIFLYRGLFSPLDVPTEPKMTPAEKRIKKATMKIQRRLKAVPAMVFIVSVLALWYSTIGESATELYNPPAKPVVSDKGQVIIPLSDPTMNLFDGQIHKFVLTEEGQAIRLLIVKKPDGKLATCLDACEICPPEGYGQRAGHVVCIYCMTPIPIDTLGMSGGCNPIPIAASITETDIRIRTEDILLKWKEVKSGKSKESIK